MNNALNNRVFHSKQNTPVYVEEDKYHLKLFVNSYVYRER